MSTPVDILHQEIACLASDFDQLYPCLNKQLDSLRKQPAIATTKKLYLFGSGDSYFACLVVKALFDWIPDLVVEVCTTFSLLHYSKVIRGQEADSLVVAVSSSGNSPRMLQCLNRLYNQPVNTLLLTANTKAKGIDCSDYQLIASLENKVSAPGIRTFQASLLGLTLLAIRLGLQHSKDSEKLGQVQQQLPRLSVLLKKNKQQLQDIGEQLAQELPEDAPIMFLGSGSNYGIAQYSAAKIIETTGRLCMGQELEEWWHVERFMKPFDMPIILLVAEGVALERAMEIKAAANGLGRKVYLLTCSTNVSTQAIAEASVAEELPEELTGFLFYPIACALSASLAASASTSFFQNSY